jgi:Frag1/DRAM/Sfk1 family
MDTGMTIPHISDIGAFTLKPLFITGSVITTIFLDLAFLSERYLRLKGRLVRNASKTENVLSNLSLVFAIIGTLGLILLSIFDSYRHGTLHNIFLFFFMGGYIVSAIFICWAYQRLGIRKWIVVNYSMDNTEYYRLPGTPDSSHLILG